MNILRTLLLTSLLLAWLSACGGKTEPNRPATEPLETEPSAAAGQDAAKPDEDTEPSVIEGSEIEEETIEIKDSADGQPLLTACVTRPDVTGLVDGAAKRAIDRYYDACYREEKEWWVGGLADFARENKKSAADCGGTFLPFTVMESSEIVYDGSAFLAIRRDVEAYTGGAHGSHMVYCENFRKADGELVTMADVFRTEDYKSVILSQIADRSSQEDTEGEYSGRDFYQNWDEMLDRSFDESSFFIGPESLTIVYQEYDIAPYSAGTQTFLVSYSDISNELSERFLQEIYGGK